MLTGTLLIPVYLTLLVNFVVFFAVLVVLIKKIRGNRSNTVANLKLALGIFSISVVLGLTWIFGAFIASGASTVFRYLFVIFNSFQGFIFFVFMVMIGREGRLFWIELLRLQSINKLIVSKSQAKLNTSQKITSTTALSPTDGDRKLLSSIVEMEKIAEAEEKDVDCKIKKGHSPAKKKNLFNRHKKCDKNNLT